MVTTDSSTDQAEEPEERRPEAAAFETPADLAVDGTLANARLVVSDGQVVRYETRDGKEQAVTKLPIHELKNPRIEDLVDAVALVADRNGHSVELLRATSRRHLQLAGAEKRLKALIEGKELPDLDDKVHVCPKCGRPLPEDTNVCEACLSRGKTIARLFSYAKPYRMRVVWGTVLTLAGTALELLPPYLTKLLIDGSLSRDTATGTLMERYWLMIWLIAALIGSRLIIMGVQIARGRNVAYLGMKMTVSIRHSLFEKFQRLSLGFYDKRNVGSIMSRMTNDTGALYDVLIDGIPVVLQQSAMLIGIPIALLLMNWEVAIWALMPIPLVFFAVNLFRRRMHRVWSRVWHNWSRMSGTLNGILQGTRVVKAFHGEGREVGRFGRRIEDLSRTGYIAESSWASFFPGVMFVMAVSGFVVWGVGGVNVLANKMTVGELTAFIAYVAMLQQPLMMLQRIIDWSTRALTAAERVFEVMDTPEDIVDASDAVAMPKMLGAVTFSGVHFGYDKTREVLHGVDLEVKAGEMIGLVGHSGAGKSTLINLLMRFYDPTQGSISVDGVDIRKIKLEDFRRQVGVVLQENYLFPGTVRDNIAYGRPDCTLEEVMAAAKAANAHDFIVNFPDGYDAYVGERGQRLSGGERQRIAIARAILHNPKILILDEATASVDTETERMIQEAIENLVEGRTVFAIAHRLSTLRNADRLVVIADGKVAEVGTHDELLSKEDGIYRKLVDMQTEINRLRENFLGE